ncbi:OPT superfamily oligopeptide transporter [Myriangium duriaei CBS 260.36]|uniref:OPT superfamily oligopeptide transporter n=1 Tax=Myriangium duriaei CBS 260.36 TaxID=1168546 RepID=A0A9P4J1U8_9PEZI|nr:OPT superfamily oligopeptide transporter [Myriangium duriaei CBS 260.36]
MEAKTETHRPADHGIDSPNDTPSLAQSEKHDPLKTGATEVGEEDASTKSHIDSDFAEDDPAIRDIPPAVRKIVSYEDDPTLPTITFRYFVLTILFVAPGAFLSQMSHFRTTYAAYSVFFVQIASNYAGMWLAKILPKKQIRLPFTRWGFNLNPAPWSTKEHVLVTISAASGATYNLGYAPVAISELYFDKPINPAVAIFFMWAIVALGYSYSAISRQFLLYDAQYPWYQALCQTALFEAQRKERVQPTAKSRKQMIVFFSVFLGVAVWQFLPEYVFPMLGSLAFLCWVAPRNATANFIGAGFGGMGFLNLSLDWSQIANNGNNLFLMPFWVEAVMFAAFVFNSWILIPAAKWGNLAEFKHGLMSTKVLQGNGTAYPLTQLVTKQGGFNATTYETYGPLYLGAQMLWGIFFSYAALTSALVWAVLFGWPSFSKSFKKARASLKDKSGKSVNHMYNDQLNVLQRSYKEVPLYWYLTLFGISFIILVSILGAGQLYIPIWTYFVAIIFGAIIVTPLGWMYALTNFQLPIGTVNELMYGVMINAISGHKNPTGATVYSSIAGDAWYRAQYILQDQKIGHYMHIPPRDTFFSQIFGCTIGIPINYGVIRWVLNSKRDILLGTKSDPTHQWTAQSLSQSLSTSVEYVLIGPTKMFKQSSFRPLPYGFLLGAAAPVLFFLLHKKFPNSKLKFRLWNTTIFFSMITNFYGNISTGYTSVIIGSFVVAFWAFRYKNDLWSRYNYLLGAAFDAGYNLNMLLIFLAFGSAKLISMPHWWGNNEESSERCFALS